MIHRLTTELSILTTIDASYTSNISCSRHAVASTYLSHARHKRSTINHLLILHHVDQKLIKAPERTGLIARSKKQRFSLAFNKEVQLKTYKETSRFSYRHRRIGFCILIIISKCRTEREHEITKHIIHHAIKT